MLTPFIMALWLLSCHSRPTIVHGNQEAIDKRYLADPADIEPINPVKEALEAVLIANYHAQPTPAHHQVIDNSIIARALSSAPTPQSDSLNPLVALNEMQRAKLYYSLYYLHSLDQAITNGESTSVQHRLARLIVNSVSHDQLTAMIRMAAQKYFSSSLLLLIAHSNFNEPLIYSVKQAYLHDQPDRVDWLTRNGVPNFHYGKLPSTTDIKLQLMKAGYSTAGYTKTFQQFTNAVDSAYQNAIAKNDLNSAELLLNLGAMPCDPMGQLLFRAVGDNRYKAVRLMLRYAVNSRFLNDALRLAMLNSHAELVYDLLEYGASPKAIDPNLIFKISPSSNALKTFVAWLADHPVVY